MVIESILINFERCSVNSVGCRTLEAELVTLAKVLAACSQMLTMDMVSIARFCQVWLGCGLWQVQRVRITLSFHNSHHLHLVHQSKQLGLFTKSSKRKDFQFLPATLILHHLLAVLLHFGPFQNYFLKQDVEI